VIVRVTLIGITDVIAGEEPEKDQQSSLGFPRFRSHVAGWCY
jgi:hypothetical protein